MVSHQKLSRICGESYQESTFEEANIEVLVKGNVFAFRGTDEPMDALRDLRILPWWVSGGIGWVPAGFFKASRRLVNKVTSTCLEQDIDHNSIEILDRVIVTMYRHGKDIVPLIPPLMRRHNKLLTYGRPESYIQDHFVKNYIKMGKAEREI